MPQDPRRNDDDHPLSNDPDDVIGRADQGEEDEEFEDLEEIDDEEDAGDEMENP